MAGFFSDFADFVLGIFSDPQARKLRKDLKALHDRLSGYRPALYNKNTDEVLSGLAIAWFNLYTLLLPLSELFSKTLNNPDKRLRDIAVNYLVEANLEGDISTRRQTLTYEALKSRLSSAPNPSTEVTKVNGEFHALLGDVKRQDAKRIDEELSSLNQLKNLVTHHFAPFFKKFGYDLSMVGKANPKFRPVGGDDLLAELLDLYYVVAPLNLTGDLERGLSLLLERISPAKAGENEKKLAKLLSKAQGLLSGPCSPMLLVSLIRVIRKEPTFLPETAKVEGQFHARYLADLQDRFTKDRDRAFREINEGSINREVSALFGDADHLLELESYNEAANERFLGAGMNPLNYIKALRILKSFNQAVMKTFYLDAIKAVLVDAFFQDKDFGARVSSVYYSAEQMHVRLEAWDRGLETEGKATFRAVEKYLKNKALGVTTANRILEVIDRQAREFLETESNEIAGLAMRVADILNDYKSPNPQNITNIKGLGGKNNRDIIKALVDGYNKSLQFLRLMQHFVVVKGSGSPAPPRPEQP